MSPFLPVLLLILAGIAALAAIGGFLYFWRSILNTLDVRKHGKHITATVTEINMEYVLLTRGGYTTSFFVHADWEDPETHTIYHFKSDAGGVYLPTTHPP